jgi:hypothetical protein
MPNVHDVVMYRDDKGTRRVGVVIELLTTRRGIPYARILEVTYVCGMAAVITHELKGLRTIDNIQDLLALNDTTS